MIYKAVVLDNSTFYQTGTIRVRIAGFFHRKMTWELAEDFPGFVEEGENDDGTNEDFDAILFSPFGGGRNYGMFILPQINEKGIVSFLGDNKRKPVWMGSIYEPAYGESNTDVTRVNIPSDDPESEGADSDGSIGGEFNMLADSEEDALKKNIVIRTKNTYRGGDSESVDWEQRPTTNIISMGEKEIRIIHFSEEGGFDSNTPKKWQEIIFGRNDDDADSITIKVNNDADSKVGKIELTEDSLIATVGEDDAVIEFVDGEMYIKTNNTPINIEDASEIKFLGDGDNLVTYADLADFLDTFLGHQHVSPNGPTQSLIDSTMKPLAPELNLTIKKFKSEKLKTE